MDYEKKYNEAMLRADEAVQKGCLDKDMFDIIFPPEESEDERIRKAIMGLTYIDGIEPILTKCSITAQDIRKYLEKQKEQKPNFDTHWENGSMVCEQKKHKPAEKQDYSGLTDLERAIHRGFLCAGVENVPVGIIKETARDCLAHLPAEWSEEDEEMLEYIIGDVNDAKQLYTTKEAKDMADKEIAWLKSLRPDTFQNGNSHWKPSEEQMKALNFAVICLFSTNYKNPTELRDLYEQLKKL